MSAKYPIIARRGVAVIATTVLSVLLLSHYVSGWILAAGIPIVVWLLFVYRDPFRDVPSKPLAVVSPADAVVLSIEEVADPFLDRQAIHIRMRTDLFPAYHLRSPLEGEMKIVEHEVHEDERCWKVMTDEGDEIILDVQGGISFGRGRSIVAFGHRVGHGQRCGVAPARGLVDVYIPVESQMKVEVGADVTGGETVLAKLRHH